MRDRAQTDVWFMEDTLPLIVCVAPVVWDEVQVARMVETWERHFARGERYALVSHTPRGGGLATPTVRRMITEWANDDRVRQISAELCVASTTVVRDALSRAAMWALLWLWKPPNPHHTCATPTEAVDWCLERLLEARLPLSRPAEELKQHVLSVLEPL